MTIPVWLLPLLLTAACSWLIVGVIGRLTSRIAARAPVVVPSTSTQLPAYPWPWLPDKALCVSCKRDLCFTKSTMNGALIFSAFQCTNVACQRFGLLSVTWINPPDTGQP